MAQGDLLHQLAGKPDQVGDDPRVLPAAAQRRATSARSAQRLRALPQERLTSDLIITREPRIGFADLLLPDETRRLFAEVHLELRREDFLIHHGVAPRRTFLFVGPPGTGKSATAEAVADELGWPLITVNLSTVVSSLLGDTARNISSVFSAAEQDPSIIFFDEFDAIGKERGESSDHGELRRVVTAFLQQLDAFVGPSILIAATNHPALLDLAAWRRFDEVVTFDLPSVHEIRSLLRLKLRSIKREKNLSIDRVAGACKGLTQADVSAIVTSAYRRHLLFEPNRPLSTEELLTAAEAAQRRAAAAHAST